MTALLGSLGTLSDVLDLTLLKESVEIYVLH